MNKEEFHKAYARILRGVAKRMELAPGTYEVRSNKGGPAVLGEVTLHGESIYIQVGGSLCTADAPDLYYRSVKGRKDYTGGVNRWDVSAQDLVNNEAEAVARFKATAVRGR